MTVLQHGKATCDGEGRPAKAVQAGEELGFEPPAKRPLLLVPEDGIRDGVQMLSQTASVPPIPSLDVGKGPQGVQPEGVWKCQRQPLLLLPRVAASGPPGGAGTQDTAEPQRPPAPSARCPAGGQPRSSLQRVNLHPKPLLLPTPPPPGPTFSLGKSQPFNYKNNLEIC